MRLLSTSLMILAGCAAAADAAERTTRPDFFIGTVTSRVGTSIRVDLGFVHGLRQDQQLAVFRSSDTSWDPVGIVAVAEVGSHQSGVRVSRGLNPQPGDLVLVSAAATPEVSRSALQHYYVTSRILTLKGRNQYDTRPVGTEVRELAYRQNMARRWYRSRDDGPKIAWGATRDVYRSVRVEALARQCQMLDNLLMDAPGAVESLSERWRTILPFIRGVPPREPTGEPAPEDADGDFATTADAVNLLPRVRSEFATEPEALQEMVAVICAAALAQPPASLRSFIRSRLLQSQFAYAVTEQETLQAIEDFIVRQL